MQQENPQPPKKDLAPSSEKGKRLAMLVKIPRARPEETPQEFSRRALKAMAKSWMAVNEEKVMDDYLSPEEEEGYARLRHKNRVKGGKTPGKSSEISSEAEQ